MRFVRFMVEGSFLLKVFLNDIGVSFLRFRGDFLLIFASVFKID